MTDYSELVKALRSKFIAYDVTGNHNSAQLYKDAAAAIEALQAEVKSYKALADEWQESAKNKERLLGLYRSEQSKHFYSYSATDNNGRIISNPCACLNIPVFPDSSESPNS